MGVPDAMSYALAAMPAFRPFGSLGKANKLRGHERHDVRMGEHRLS